VNDDELEMICYEVVVRYNAGISLEGLKNTTKNVSQDSRDHDLNP
jgi:hypothetical protein